MKERLYDDKTYKVIKELIENGNLTKAMSIIKKTLDKYL